MNRSNHRRLLAFLTAGVLATTAAGCGSDEEDAATTTAAVASSAPTSAAASETTAAAGTETTEAAGTETTEAAGTETTEGGGAETTEGGGAETSDPVCSGDEEPGITDTSITFGQTYPLSGPAAAYASIPVGAQAYIDHLNESGGLVFGDGTTRMIETKLLDDQYSPPKAVENAEQLVEQDEVFLILNPLGTPNNLAIRDYMNAEEVPQLFVATGAATWGADIEEYPWTIGWQPDYESEGKAYAEYILQENPDAKIGLLKQNDDFGGDYERGLIEGLGDSADQIVATVSYEVTDATIDTQVSQLKDAGADTFASITTPKFAIQAIKRRVELGWDSMFIMSSVSSSVGAVIDPAGKDLAKDMITSVYLKDPTDPAYDADPAMIEYNEILSQFAPDANPDDGLNLYGMAMMKTVEEMAAGMTEVCRASIMAAATNLDVENDLLIDGVTISTGEGDAFPIQAVQIQIWDGEVYEKIGEVIDAG